MTFKELSTPDLAGLSSLLQSFRLTSSKDGAHLLPVVVNHEHRFGIGRIPLRDLH